MTRTRDISTTLRSLDAADQNVRFPTARARTDLERILASDPSPAPHGAGRRRGAGRVTRRLAVSAGVLAVATVGAVALPSLTGGDHAFASWTRIPAGLTQQERADAADTCRRAQRDGPGAEYADDLDGADPVIAERRGVWTTVVLAGADGFSAMCITDDSTRLFADGMIGSIGRFTDYTPPGPRDLIGTSLGAGTMNAGELSLAAGIVGSDVVGIVYQSRTHGEVTATVSGGHFAFWLPGDELEDASRTGVEVDVTYRDGSTGTSRLTLQDSSSAAGTP